MNHYWILPPAILCAVIALLVLIALVALKSKRTGRSMLYCGAAKIQALICLAAAALPTIATVVEELPERFANAWAMERGKSKARMDVVRPMKSA